MKTEFHDSNTLETRLRKKVGSVIANRRGELGVSQEKLAEKSNLHRNTIGLIERGEKSVTIYHLHSIAEALDVSASQILDSAGY